MVQFQTQKVAIVLGLLVAAPVFADSITQFTAGDIVVSVEGCGIQGGTCTGIANGTGANGSYGDNQAAPLSLFQFGVTGTSSATYAGSLVLPQTTSGSNFAVSGEYGSSSEGTLQLSGNGQYLTIMGYGINAATFNADPAAYSASNTNTALAQSGSLTGQSYTPVARVVALVGANGSVNSSTGLYNVFNGNNPRSAYTADGTNIYVSGQGTSPDSTGGVFYTTVGSSSATSITGNDTTSKTHAQDTRDVQIYNGQLYVSVDSTEGSGSNRSFIGTLGSGTPTTLANNNNGPTMLPGDGNSGGTGKETITTGANSTGNGLNGGDQINLSPENYFFANSTTLYIADSGDGKQTSATSSLGDGGLQKWTFNGSSWVLDYTLSAGLGLVANTNSDGTSGLLGLTGEVVNGQVELFATNYTLSDLDQTYLYGITDTLSDTLASQVTGEAFSVLAAAPADSNFKGVSFAPTSEAAPTPEPASFALFGLGSAAILYIRRRKSL